MFLHPWAIAVGIAAAALPFAIHFLTRPRPVRMPLSTLRFVRQAVEQRRARHRLRDATVLALRALALLALAACIARPVLGRKATMADDDARLLRIVVADVSQSMAAVHQGVQLFERTRPLVARRLENKSGTRANLILAAARPASVFEQASSNYAMLREALATARPLPQRCDVQAALNLASELIARDGSHSELRREVVIVSDFQRTNWGAADFSVFPEGVEIILESVAPAEPLPNLGLLRVAAQGRPEAGRLARLEVDVGNYSPTPQNVRVDVTIGGLSVQLGGMCPAFGRTTLTGELVPPEPGWPVGEAKLIGVEDALADDNARPCVMEVRPPPQFALVTRQPEKSRPSSAYYLERALVPIDERKGAGGKSQATTVSRVTRVDPERLDVEALAAFDLVVVDHPGTLTTQAVNLLAAFLRRGRAVFYVAAEAADAANLRLLSEALGARWQLPVEYLPPRAARPRRDLFLAEMRREEAPFSVFGDEADTLFGPLRFAGGLDTRPREGALADEILARYNDGSACLVLSAVEAGEILILNADVGTSNLPGSAAFVPLVGELVQRLLVRAGGAADIACGEPFAVPLPSATNSTHDLELAGVEPGSSVAGEVVPEAGGVLWRSEAAGPPGVYRVRHGDEVVFALAAAIPAAESDLRTLSGRVFQERLAGGRHVVFQSATGSPEDERDTSWTWLAIACVTCVLGEVVALRLLPV
ncbi:MAG: BatA domain-containing protein [Planctomycetaceae bacterium]